MKKLEVLFLSAQPAARYFFSKFYINNPNINIGVNNYSFFDGPKNLDYNKYNIITFDDGSLKRKDLEKICVFIAGNDSIKKIIYTGYYDVKYFNYLRLLGMNGILSKAEEVPVFNKAIKKVAANKYFLSNNIIKFIKQSQLNIIDMEILTYREREIILLSEQGLKNKEIAKRLLLSTKTIENHKQNIKNKCGKEILDFHINLKVI